MPQCRLNSFFNEAQTVLECISQTNSIPNVGNVDGQTFPNFLAELWVSAKFRWYTYSGEIGTFLNGATVAASSRQDGGLTKLNCFIRLDEVSYWLSKTRELIAGAETYSYPAFRESFRELRRESRKSEMELVVALFHFERAMKKALGESRS
jgi:hypothetical protein